MKKAIVGVFVAGMFFMVKSPLFAGDYSVALTTYPATEVATMEVQLTGTKKVDSLIISSTGTLQVVTVYNSCASTTTAIAVVTVHAPSTPLEIKFDGNYNNPLTLTSACFRKSDSSAPVYISVHYR